MWALLPFLLLYIDMKTPELLRGFKTIPPPPSVFGLFFFLTLRMSVLSSLPPIAGRFGKNISLKNSCPDLSFCQLL